MTAVNEKFPDFALLDQNGQTRRLGDYAGKWLVIYFYPKDNTSACTLEAQSFSFLLKDFGEEGAAVLGVSPDSVKSHAGFADKKELTLTLLSDAERALAVATGVWQKKKLYGKEYMGVARSTFLVDPSGVVREAWSKVKAAGHAEAVLERLKELRKGG